MNNLNIITTAEAENDINGIISYIELDNTHAALEFSKMLKKDFIYLSKYPNMGKKRPDWTDEDVLFFIIKWGYKIVYKVQNNDLFILRILSGYQDATLIF